MPSLSAIAKFILPLAMLGGGGVAWASALSQNPSGTGVAQVWIDSPGYGERLPAGDVAVTIHASAPGGVSEIELLVDDKAAATKSVQGDDRLAKTTITWSGTEGVHQLRARARSSAGWSQPGPVVVVQIGKSSNAPVETTTTPPQDPADTPGTPGEEVTGVQPEPGPTISPSSPNTPSGSTSPSDPTDPSRPPVTQPGPVPSSPPATSGQSPTTTTSATSTTLPAPAISVSGPFNVKVGSNALFKAVTDTGGRPLSQTSITIFIIQKNGRPLPTNSSKTCVGTSTCEFTRSFNTIDSYKYYASVTTGGVTATTPPPAKVIETYIG